jgi:hypothetical protein
MFRVLRLGGSGVVVGGLAGGGAVFAECLDDVGVVFVGGVVAGLGLEEGARRV